MANDFFKNGDKGYSENFNDSILVGNAFDWTVTISLPDDTGDVFPSSSSVVKAKVADMSITPNSNLSIGSTISNSSGSSQVYRLTVYPNFNRYGGFKSLTLTADSGVTFYIANKGGNSPIANNLDYTNLGNVPELKVLKEYDIVLTIPTGKSVTGLDMVLQSKSADVSGSIAQSNVTGLTSALATIPTKTSDLTNDGEDGTNVFIADNDSRLSDTRNPKATEITESANLNTYQTPGFYYSPNVARTDSLSNCPVTNTGFALFVDKNTGYRQILVTRDKTNPYVYTRNFMDAAWSDWIGFPLGVEQKSISVTSATSGSNYFSGGTRTITATRWGKMVNVYVNFYNINAKQSTTNTDTVIGTLPEGWRPKLEQHVRCTINANSNITYAMAKVKTNGEICIRMTTTETISSATMDSTFTFITP